MTTFINSESSIANQSTTFNDNQLTKNNLTQCTSSREINALPPLPNTIMSNQFNLPLQTYHNQADHINCPPTTEDKLTFISINANNSLRKNISLYIESFQSLNISIMAVQEPGELTSINYSTPFSVDSNTLFELKQAQLSAVTKHNKDKRYSLVFLVRNSLIPFIKNNASSVEGYQSIELTKPYNLTIINTYFQHNQTIRKITFGKVQSSIKKLRNNFIILGDFNSIIDRQLDHYSSHNSCPPQKNSASLT